MVRAPVFKFLHRCLRLGAAALLVLAFTLGAEGAQPAQAATSTQISEGWLPFVATFPNSNIHLNGLVHIVARWQSVLTARYRWTSLPISPLPE